MCIWVVCKRRPNKVITVDKSVATVPYVNFRGGQVRNLRPEQVAAVCRDILEAYDNSSSSDALSDEDTQSYSSSSSYGEDSD